MGAYKARNPMLQHSISEVVEEITQELSTEKSANELCEKLKAQFCPPKTPLERK